MTKLLRRDKGSRVASECTPWGTGALGTTGWGKATVVVQLIEEVEDLSQALEV
jgi:hypothetical protein